MPCAAARRDSCYHSRGEVVDLLDVSGVGEPVEGAGHHQFLEAGVVHLGRNDPAQARRRPVAVLLGGCRERVVHVGVAAVRLGELADLRALPQQAILIHGAGAHDSVWSVEVTKMGV